MQLYVASVVPDIMHSFSSAIIKYFGHKPVIVSAGIKSWYPSSDRESKTDGAGSNCGCGCRPINYMVDRLL